MKDSFEKYGFYGLIMVVSFGVITKAFFIANIKNVGSATTGFTNAYTYFPDELGKRITFVTQAYPYSVTTDMSPKKVTWCCATIYGNGASQYAQQRMGRIVWQDGSQYSFRANEKVAIYMEIPLGRYDK